MSGPNEGMSEPEEDFPEADAEALDQLYENNKLAESNSLLFARVQRADYETVRRLIESIVDPHEANIALIGVVCSPIDDDGKCRLIELLMAKGVDVNFGSETCYTVLDFAIHQASAEVVRLLVRHGASLDGFTGQRLMENLIVNACIKGDLHMAFGLLEPGPCVDDSMSAFILLAALCGDGDDGTKALFVKLLVAKGTDVNWAFEGQLPLYSTCARPNPRLLLVLLECGARVNAATDNGRTALHGLCATDYDKINQGYGDAADEEKRSRFNKDVIGCAKILLEHGAEVDVGDAEGKTPIALARKSGKRELIDLLENHL